MKKQEIIEKYGIEEYERRLRKHREYKKIYNQEHREERSEYSKQYYQEYKGEILEHQKQYRQTQYGRAIHLSKGYLRTDKTKGFETNITPQWIVDNIFTSKCYYCEESDWTKLGTDRIDNTKGHTIDNVICACGKCNSERQDKYTVKEFKRYKQIRPKIA